MRPSRSVSDRSKHSAHGSLVRLERLCRREDGVRDGEFRSVKFVRLVLAFDFPDGVGADVLR